MRIMSYILAKKYTISPIEKVALAIHKKDIVRGGCSHSLMANFPSLFSRFALEPATSINNAADKSAPREHRARLCMEFESAGFVW